MKHSDFPPQQNEMFSTLVRPYVEENGGEKMALSKLE
jgi:hypothetical protein